MNITIKNASIKSKLFLKYGYDHFVGTTKYSHPSTTGDAPIHDDLREAFESLTPHFAFICEEISESECRQAIIDLEKGILNEFGPTKNYAVGGFTLGKDSEGITISGTKNLDAGDVLNINTPFKKWDNVDYPFMNELIATVDSLKSEVYEYIEGKRAPVKHQTIDMFEGKDDDDNASNSKHFADAEM